MAERLIAMQDNNQFQTLCGSFDENLKLLEQRYHVQMICRGDELRIQGDGAAVELAAGAVTALLKMIAAGQAVTPQSIHYVSDMVDEGASGQLAELADDDTVCLTAAGKPVHTRTVGQRSYVRAIAENTIVFGLGPAGTGKTYLAVAMAVRAFRRHEISRIILTRPAVETFSIPMKPATVHYLLLQKSTGRFMLVVWDEKYSGGNEKVTINFDNTFKSVKIYDPTYSSSEIETLDNVNSVRLTMSTYPFVLELQK